MCTVKPKCVPLPEQHSFCSQPNSGCRYVEVKTGRTKWEKRTAVLVRVDGEPDAKLVIYTYFLKGLGAGKPLIGQMYQLNKLKKLEVKREKEGVFVLNLVTDKGSTLSFRTSGNDAGNWIAAVMSGSLTSLTHETHTPVPNGTISNIESDLKEKPDNNVYTGSREGYVAPVNDGSASDEKKKKESNNNKNEGGGKSDEKKKESDKKLKPTVSKTQTKPSTSESRKTKEAKTLATTQTQDAPPPKPDEPLVRTHSDPDCEQLKKTQTETYETSGRGIHDTPNQKLTTPISTTPGASLTPALTPADKDEKKKTLTNSDENEAPEKKH